MARAGVSVVSVDKEKARLYDAARWRRIKADPVLLAKVHAQATARAAAKRAADPEWHARAKARMREYARQHTATQTQKTRDWRREHPGCRSTEHLSGRYALSRDEYNGMVTNQHGRCAICQRVPAGVGKMAVLRVDHDHDTGVVRALLCHTCNAGLGMFGDEAGLIERAAMYLRQHARTRVSA